MFNRVLIIEPPIHVKFVGDVAPVFQPHDKHAVGIFPSMTTKCAFCVKTVLNFYQHSCVEIGYYKCIQNAFCDAYLYLKKSHEMHPYVCKDPGEFVIFSAYQTKALMEVFPQSLLSCQGCHWNVLMPLRSKEIGG